MTFPQEFFATATKLDPAIVIDGTTYTHALKWSQPDDSTIVSGTVSSISGTTTKTIVCNRAFQTSSFTENDPTYGNFLREIPVLMGGNIVARSEPWRLYNASNTGNAFRGSDSQKLEPGHCIEYNGKRFLITGVGTQAPASVAWQGTDPIAAAGVHTVKTTEFRLTFPDQQSVTLELKDDATDVYTDGGVAVENTASPGTFTTLTRKIFNSDPDVYPDDAQIGADSYFYESGSGTVILGTGTESTGTNFFAFYFWRGLTETPTTGDTIILEGAGEYASTTDDVARVLRTCSEDTDYTFFVFNKGSNSYGVGSCEFRLTTDDDSPVCVLSWDNTGFTGASQRTTAGGASAAVTLSATPTFNGSNDAFLLKVNRTTTTITVSYSENTTSPSYTTIATFTVSSLEALQTAYLGFSCPADEFIATGYLGATGVLYGDGVLATRQFVNLTISTLTMDVGLASTRPIDTITNLSTGEEMTSSTTPARDHYTTVTDGIRLYNEAQGDKIRILHEVELSAPATPGYAARITNTVNLATQGSTTVSENLAHYHDTLVVADPDEELLITVGESFDGKLSVFSEEISDLEFDIFGDVTSDWTAMDAADYLSRDVGRWVLLAEDFTATHDVLAMCFRTNTPRMVANASAFAGVYNDLATGLESLEDQWVNCGVSGGDYEIEGLMQSYGIHPSGFTCTASGPAVDGYVVGTAQGFFANFFQGYSNVSDFDFYDVVSSRTAFRFGIGDTDTLRGTAASYLSTCAGINYSLGAIGSEGAASGYLFASPSVSGSTFGCDYVDAGAGAVGPAEFVDLAITGFGFTPSGVLKNMAALGATCVEAVAIIEFAGLQVSEWEYTRITKEPEIFGTSLPANNEDVYAIVTENGALVSEYETANDGTVLTSTTNTRPSLNTSGEVSLKAFGIRNDSKKIYLPEQDEFRDIEDNRIVSLGASISTGSNVTSGDRCKINATSAVNEMLDFYTEDLNSIVLFPTFVDITPLSGEGDLIEFMSSMQPQTTLSTSLGGGIWTITEVTEGKRFGYSDFTIHGISARFRLSSGAITNPVPIIRDSLI